MGTTSLRYPPSTSLRSQQGRLVLPEPFHLSRAYRRAIELLLSFIYIHSVLSADRYYGLDRFGSFSISALIVYRFSINGWFDLADCARSRDLRHAMTNFLVELYSQVWRSR